MLTRILFVILITINSITIRSQIHEPKLIDQSTGVWSISYNAGPCFSIKDQSGYKLSMEIGYHETQREQFLLNFSTSYLIESPDIRYNILECSIGPRVLLFKKKNLFVEANLGFQLNKRSKAYNYNSYNSLFAKLTRTSYYFAAGAGIKFPLNRSNSLLIGIKYNSVIPFDEGFSYINAQFGLDFNNSEVLNIKKRAIKKISISATAGKLSPFEINGNDLTGNAAVSLEAAMRTNDHAEIYFNTGFYSINNLFEKRKNNLLSFTLGTRFYINKNVLSSFMEFGGGAYIQTEYDGKKFDPIQPGLNLGTGFTISVSNTIELIFKGKIDFILTDNPSFPPLSSLTGGVRFNL